MDNDPSASVPGDPAAGYAAFMAAAKQVEALLRAHPDATEQDLADAYVYLAGQWHFYVARYFKGGDVDRPCFVRDMESFRSWGLPTPNHHYYSAEIDGAGEYLIHGRRGDVADYCFEVLSGLAGDDGVVGERIDALESANLRIEPDGHFTLRVGGPPRAANWLKAGPKARVIFVRQTVDDWSLEQPTPMLIERVDGERAERLFRRPSPAEAEALYRRAAKGLVDQVTFLHNFALNWGRVLDENAFDAPAVGPADAGYFPGQFNCKCRWRIGADEALLITFKPPAARYQSLDLAHPLWFNSLYPREVASSLTGAQSRLSSDGLYRFVVAATDPGSPNWLDTAGLLRGFLFMRWQRVSGPPPGRPEARVVKLADLRAKLPADEPQVSPEERRAQQRLRRLAMDRRYF